ncbi:helix-turn-helix domain-containing protein [Streptomyces zaomyceticus]|uniref:helix-turn-helix domain-containing protein n=1 Tax=Streptomyces zaomyceticus TaxID=68286 RepID=UPI003719DA48
MDNLFTVCHSEGVHQEQHNVHGGRHVIEDAPKCRLVSAELLRTLMQRTGTGKAVTIRQLARHAGVAHGVIGELLTGVRDTVSATAAQRIAQRIGVDLLILFVPSERADSSRPYLRLTDSA